MKKDNPLSAGAPKTLVPQPNVLVIFGGDGDLAWRKLLPAIYNLNVDGVLPSHFAVVCFGIASTEEGRNADDADAYIRARARDGISRSTGGSRGGSMALRLALEAPARFERLRRYRPTSRRQRISNARPLGQPLLP